MGDARRRQVCLSRFTDGAGGRLWVLRRQTALSTEPKPQRFDSSSCQPRPGSFGPRHVPTQACTDLHVSCLVCFWAAR